MKNLLIVAFGGALGALARYGLSSWTQTRIQGAFPWGTLVVNATGCLAIGVLWHLVEDKGTVGPAGRLLIATGILGAFTTFSAFGLETVVLIQTRQFAWALGNVAGNVILGFGFVWLGRAAPTLLGL